MKKIPLAMRCTLFMLFCLVGMTFANEGYAQKTMVNIALENKTVDEVLTELEQGADRRICSCNDSGRKHPEAG
jgi:hypothetical protein